MNNCLYFTANEVQEILGISRTQAYRIVRQLNKELEEKGYIVIPGRVPKKYLTEKYYGM